MADAGGARDLPAPRIPAAVPAALLGDDARSVRDPLPGRTGERRPGPPPSLGRAPRAGAPGWPAHVLRDVPVGLDPWTRTDARPRRRLPPDPLGGGGLRRAARPGMATRVRGSPAAAGRGATELTAQPARSPPLPVPRMRPRARRPMNSRTRARISSMANGFFIARTTPGARSNHWMSTIADMITTW